jgi:hypothetical protein
MGFGPVLKEKYPQLITVLGHVLRNRGTTDLIFSFSALESGLPESGIQGRGPAHTNQQEKISIECISIISIDGNTVIAT